jgi:glycerol-3-phosphate acyltransferase PlsY
MFNSLYPLFYFLISYLLGSFPTAYLVTRKFVGKDIRAEESKNVGAMNFLLVAAVDIGKGAFSVWLPQKLSFLGYDLILATTISAFGVVLGHCFSIYFKIKEGKFSGGKAQASLIGVLAVLNFKWLFLPWAGIAISFVISTQTQFMGNLFLLPISYLLVPEYFWACLLMALPIFIKQYPHLIPALKGARPKWYFKKKSKIDYSTSGDE